MSGFPGKGALRFPLGIASNKERNRPIQERLSHRLMCGRRPVASILRLLSVMLTPYKCAGLGMVPGLVNFFYARLTLRRLTG